MRHAIAKHEFTLIEDFAFGSVWDLVSRQRCFSKKGRTKSSVSYLEFPRDFRQVQGCRAASLLVVGYRFRNLRNDAVS